MKFCINCGNSLPNAAIFCSRCGERQDAEDTAPAAKKFCIYCGNSIPNAAIFCSKCGERQDDEDNVPAAAAPAASSRPVQAPSAPKPAPAPAAPAVTKTEAPASAPQPAPRPAPAPQVRSSAKGLKYADMKHVLISMQDKNNMPKDHYTPPPYVLAPEKDDRTYFLSNHYRDVTSVISARLNDQPNGNYRSDVSLDICSDYLRITVSESLLLMISWEWVALTFDTIRKISTFSDGRWQGCVIEFVNQDCHPLRLMSKSKHFPEVINRLSSYTGLSISRD